MTNACTCGAATEGEWADKHSPDCPALRTTITLFLAVNEVGDNQMSWESADEAVGELRDNYGFKAVRVVTLSVTVELPQPETVNVVAVMVPDEAKSPAEVAVS